MGKRLKDVENDKMMDTDYEKMDEMLHDLQTKNKQKEQELNDYKKFVSQKESENKSLRVSVNSHNQTINKLESILAGLKYKEKIFEEKKKKIDKINLKIKKRRKSIQMIYSKSAELAKYSKSADFDGDIDDADDGKVEFKPFNSDKLLAVKPYKLEITKPDKPANTNPVKKGHQFTTSY